MRYAHTNIAAKNWRTLADFYIKIFDCKVKPPERDMAGEWLDSATGLENAQLQGVHLLLPGYGENGPTLEIFSYKKMIHTEKIMANHTGFTHIAFEVDDVDSIFTKALENGGTTLGKVIKKEVQGVGMLKFVYLRDPEGNIIEIQSWN